MQIVCNLHEISKPIFWEKQEKYSKLSSAKTLTKRAQS